MLTGTTPFALQVCERMMPGYGEQMRAIRQASPAGHHLCHNTCNALQTTVCLWLQLIVHAANAI